MAETETPFRPEHAEGIDLSYKDNLSASGFISPKHLKIFIRTRRDAGLGPTTIYYAGMVAPAISAGTFKLFESFFAQYNLSPQTAYLLVLCLSASAGLSWFLTFNRLAQRDRQSRDHETEQSQEVKIERSGIFLTRTHIETKIDWPAIVDIRTTKHYIAFIVEGANDFFIPVDWFKDREQMMEAARKISALRPPPFK